MLAYTPGSNPIQSNPLVDPSYQDVEVFRQGLLGRLELPLLSMRRSPDRRAAALPGGTNRFWLM